MRNIWKIFKHDFKKLTNSAVAIVVIVGICIVPSLYAWFNILSNWDPYGIEATSSIHVSVYSEDKGQDLLGIKVNIGDLILDKLNSNDQLGWVIEESRDDTIHHVCSGDSYAALIVPAGFTRDFLSVLKGDLKHPQILYFENQKENAIAPKVTSKARTAIQNQINSTIIEKLAGALESLSKVFKAMGLDINEVASSITENLDKASQSLMRMDLMMDSLEQLVKDTDSVLDAGGVTLGDVQAVIDQGKKMTAHAGEDFVRAEKKMEQTSAAMTEMLVEISDRVLEIEEIIGSIAGDETAVQTLIRMTEDLQELLYDTMDTFPLLSEILTEVIGRLDEVLEILNQWDISPDIEALYRITSEIIDILNGAIQGIGSVVFDSLDHAVDMLSSTLANVSDTLDTGGAAAAGLSEKLDALKITLGQADTTIADAKTLIGTITGIVNELDTDAHIFFESEFFRTLTNIMNNKEENLAEYLASPVQVNTETFYKIETYGSAMAPFYIVLALFVGALFCGVLINVNVKTEDPEIENATKIQKFFGRYLLFFFISIAQTLITTLGCLNYIGIQCLHPVLFVLGCFLINLNFSIMNYAFVYAMGNVGMMLSVIVMLLQVAGSGGAYPVDVMPPIFGALYPFMPFHYAMDMLRETIGGMYRYTYWVDMGIMLGMCLLFIAIGFLFKKPGDLLNNAIMKGRKDSGIM